MHPVICKIKSLMILTIHKVANRYLAAIRDYYCQQSKIILNLVDKKEDIKSEKHKNNEMWFCEACEKYINNNSKSIHIKCNAQIKKIFFF